jgi:opacity protein-like surface antigen
MTARSILSLVLVSLIVPPAYAQGNFGLEVLGGLYRPQDANGLKPIGGAALRFKLSALVGIEASINYREETYSSGSIAVKSWPVMVTGLLYPIPPIYLAMGTGWYSTSVHYRVPAVSPAAFANDTKQQIGWQIGAGVELPVFSFVEFVGDVRYVIRDHRFEPLSGANGVSGNSPVVTAGLLFAL